MKTWLIATTLWLFSAGAWAANTVRVEVNGMVCAFCAAAIEKSLTAMPETKGVYVNLGKKIVAIELKEGKSANLEAVRTQIRNAGYDVVNIGESGQTLAEIKAGIK